MSATSPRIDYLSRLPNELLYQIFDDAYTDLRQHLTWPVRLTALLHPLSKRLVDIQRRQLYDTIHLRGKLCLHRLIKLANRVSGRPQLGTLTKSLKIDASLPLNAIGRAKRTDLEGGTLRRLLGQLPGLRSMEVYGSAATEVPGLLECLRRDCLPPRCTILSIALQSGQISIVTSLPAQLQQLDVSIFNTQAVTCLPSPSLPQPTFSHLTHLSIDRPDIDLRSWLSFTARCPELTDLALSGTNQHSTYAIILRAVPVPASITSLSINVARSYYPDTPIDTSALPLSHLPNLKYFTLGGWGDHSQTLLEILHHPKIEELTIAPKTPLPPVNLLLLVSSPRQNRSLRSIDVQSEPSSEGARSADLNLEEDYGDDHLFAADLLIAEESFFADWELEGLPDGLDANDLVQLREVGTGSGITVQGSVYQALEVEKAYEEDVELFRGMWLEWTEEKETKRRQKRWQRPVDESSEGDSDSSDVESE